MAPLVVMEMNYLALQSFSWGNNFQELYSRRVLTSTCSQPVCKKNGGVDIYTHPGTENLVAKVYPLAYTSDLCLRAPDEGKFPFL